MFIMIAGLESTGVIGGLLNLLKILTGTNALIACLIIMWSAALLTMVTSAVPFVLAMIPVIKGLGFDPVTPLWWSLALGACLGANGTFIGSAANMVVVGISNKSGHKISFGRFLRKGLPVTMVSLVLASVYVWLRYFVVEGNTWGISS
jgi:Na+/H+ antiporter NhaD/arsenite permease-like protein